MFGLKNFRVFENQINLDLAPITILTGPNNSGKSTFIRGLKLITESAENEGLWSILTRPSQTDYQSFKKLISEGRQNESIEFVYELEDFAPNKIGIPSKVRIELVYSTDEKFASFGNLSAFKIYDIIEGQCIFSSKSSFGPLYDNYVNEEHTGKEDEKDYSFIKYREAINLLCLNLKNKLSYIPTHRSNPQREFSRNSDNYLSKHLFEIIDEKNPSE